MNSVLIIDDDKKLCALMKKCVEQENLSAVVAHGGLEGLRLLEKNKDTCSLIILDVMMPDNRLGGTYSDLPPWRVYRFSPRCVFSQ